jgi:hypothetical protein
VTGRVFDDGHGPDNEQQATVKYQITQCFIRRERDPAMHPAGVKVFGGELATVNVSGMTSTANGSVRSAQNPGFAAIVRGQRLRHIQGRHVEFENGFHFLAFGMVLLPDLDDLAHGPHIEPAALHFRVDFANIVGNGLFSSSSRSTLSTNCVSSCAATPVSATSAVI